MKKDNNKVYRCACGCGGHTSVLHEIIFGCRGRKGGNNRDICIEYNVQVPLTGICPTIFITLFRRGQR